MYNEEYDDEQDVKTNDNFLVNFYYNNKVLIWILIGVVAFILIMSLLTKGGSNNTTKNSYDVTILPEKDVEISIGNSYTLKAKVNNNANAVISWSSENESIAKVDNGTVTAVGYGKTKIYATYIHSDNKKYTGYKDVVVADGNPNLKLTDVSFKNGSLLMPLNSTYKISLSLTPSNGYVTNKVFTSSNESVATVDNNGLVTSIGEGEAIISLNVNDGTFRKDLKVYVNRDYTRSEIIVSPEKISFDGELIKMRIGSSEKLKYTLFPTDSDASKLVWTSSDESVVKVDQNGIVRALEAGSARVTLKSVTGVNDSIDIEVEQSIIEVTDINLNLNSLYLNVGQSEVITPTISPADASNKALSFAVGDSSIVAVAPNQVGTSATVYALRAGTTTITVSSNNNIEKRINVTVAGNSSGGGSSSGGGGSSSNQGFTISSSDANGGRFIVNTYNATINNEATAPVSITLQITDSSIAKLRVAICSYSASSCDPSTSAEVKEIVGSGSFTINTSGTFVLRVGKYNSQGALIGTVDKYIAVKGSSSSGGSSSQYACYCNSNNYCSWATGISSSFPNKSTTYDTEAKCKQHIQTTCCHRSGTNYVNSLTVQSNCVSSSYCGISSAKITIEDKSGTGKVLKGASGTTYDFNESSNKDGTFTNSIASGSSNCIALAKSSFAGPLNAKAGAKLGIPIKRVNDNLTCTGTVIVTFKPNDGSATVTERVSISVKPVSGSTGGSTGGSTSPKAMSSLSYSCNNGKIIIKDGTKTLTSNDYSCTSVQKRRGYQMEYYYTCTGKGNYTGSKNYSCYL